jgi:AAA family ATP:ADP antiporter
VFKHRYLLLIAALVLLSNLVNTTGEFILGKTVERHAEAAVAAGVDTTPENYIGEFYSTFFFWVNLLGATLQMLVVSRVMKYIGIAPALFILPLIALGGYTMLAFLPVLPFIRAVKILENGTDYSIQNTARHALFLTTSREAKYKAKAAIDTFFWRSGDALSGLLVLIGTYLTFDVKDFAIVNTLLILAWIGTAIGIVRLRMKHGPAAPAAARGIGFLAHFHETTTPSSQERL